jgi:hypothetical protein
MDSSRVQPGDSFDENQDMVDANQNGILKKMNYYDSLLLQKMFYQQPVDDSCAALEGSHVCG